MELLTLLDVLCHAGIGLAIECFVERFAESLGGFGHLFLDLVVDLGYLLFDEHVGAIALLGVAVVDQRIVECVDVAGSLPDGGVHEYGGVDSDDVLVEESHGVPPVAFDVVFEFDTVLAVVVDGSQAVVDFT